MREQAGQLTGRVLGRAGRCSGGCLTLGGPLHAAAAAAASQSEPPVPAFAAAAAGCSSSSSPCPSTWLCWGSIAGAAPPAAPAAS